MHQDTNVPSDALVPDHEHEAWALVRQSRPNVLLIGSEVDMESAITFVAGCSPACLPHWSLALAQTPPDMTPDTVVVRNVAALDDGEQHRLHGWLDERVGRVRVIATATVPMYPLVERGEFLESLYYRLNIVCVEFDAAPASSRTQPEHAFEHHQPLQPGAAPHVRDAEPHERRLVQALDSA